MTYGAECWAVRKKDENRLHVADMMMLRRIWGKTRNDHVRNQVLQEDSKVCQMSTLLGQNRLNWYGHIRRREEDNLTRKTDGHGCMWEEKNGWPRRRWIDNTREDLKTMN